MHHGYIQDWENRQMFLIVETPPHDQHTFDEYLQWLHRSTRTHIREPFSDHAIKEDELYADDVEDAYDVATRQGTQPERAPL